MVHLTFKMPSSSWHQHLNKFVATCPHFLSYSWWFIKIKNWSKINPTNVTVASNHSQQENRQNIRVIMTASYRVFGQNWTVSTKKWISQPRKYLLKK